MAVTCGAKCAKVMLIVFNFIFWLSGAALLGIGIWMLVDKDIVNILKFVNLEQDNPMLDYAAYVLIAVGSFVFLVGFCGCCGAIRESKCLLGLYIFCLLIVMCGEIAVGVLAILYKDKVTAELEKNVKNVMREKYMFNKTTVDNEIVDVAQISFKCCGMMSEKDWDMSNFQNQSHVRTNVTTTQKKVPWSCCKRKAGEEIKKKEPWAVRADDVEDCTTKPTAATANLKGCHDAAKDWFESKAIILIGVGIGIACLEIFGFIFALCLCRHLGEED